LLTDKHDDWYLWNGGHVDHWSCLLTINLQVSSRTSIVIFLEIARRCFLSIMVKLFPWTALRELGSEGSNSFDIFVLHAPSDERVSHVA
jgi:hypothetical protein